MAFVGCAQGVLLWVFALTTNTSISSNQRIFYLQSLSSELNTKKQPLLFLLLFFTIILHAHSRPDLLSSVNQKWVSSAVTQRTAVAHKHHFDDTHPLIPWQLTLVSVHPPPHLIFVLHCSPTPSTTAIIPKRKQGLWACEWERHPCGHI